MTQLGHTFQFIAIRGVSAAASLSFIVVATQLMDPTEFGVYAFWFLVANFSYSLLFHWVRFSYAREVTREDADDDAALIRAFTTVGQISAIVGATCIVAYVITQSAYVLLAGLICILQGFTGVHLEKARVTLNVRSFGAFWVTRSVLASAIGIAFLLTGIHSEALLVAHVIALSLPLFIWSQIPRRTYRSIFNRPLASLPYATYGASIALTYLVDAAVSLTNRTILIWNDDLDSLGVYSACYDIVWPLVMMIGLSIVSTALPRILLAGTAGRDNTSSLKHIRNSSRIFAFFAFPALIAALFAGQTVLVNVIGAEYREGFFAILPLLVLTAILHVLRVGFLEPPLQASGDSRTSLKVSTVIVLANTVLSTAGYFALGILGVVAGSLAANLLGFLLSSSRFVRQCGFAIDLGFVLQCVLVNLAASAIWWFTSSPSVLLNSLSLAIALSAALLISSLMLRRRMELI